MHSPFGRHRRSHAALDRARPHRAGGVSRVPLDDRSTRQTGRLSLDRGGSLGRSRSRLHSTMVSHGCGSRTSYRSRLPRSRTERSSYSVRPSALRSSIPARTWVTFAFNVAGQAEPRTLIKRDQCRDLSGYMSSDKRSPTQEQIVAVHVLTHESMHMGGVAAEAEAECLAVGSDARMAELLGAPPDAARALALSYWTNVYPRMPDQYRSTECDPWAPRP
jgi:hypothetical protein